MMRAPPIGPWRWFDRILVIVGYSWMAGMACGAVYGSIVPLIGTVVGALAGGGVGIVVCVFVAPLIIRRDVRRAFSVMLRASMIVAGAWVLIGWACASAGWFGDSLPDIYAFVGLPSVVLSYIGGAWWARSRCPIVWPRSRFGLCRRCGYSLAGLAGRICPECGHDNEHKRLAQPE